MGWAIEVARFEGRRADRKAERLADRLREELRIADVWWDTVGYDEDKAVVYRGQYVDPKGVIAQEDLQQTRRLRLDGRTPFELAELVDLGGTTFLTDSPLDLSRHPGKYSLMIGYYDARLGEDYRLAAEEVAQMLRERGEEAYVYHVPDKSAVTIGLFDVDAFATGDDGQRTYSQAVREVQQKHPTLMGNGRTIVMKRDGRTLGEMQTYLIFVER
jgi:hypothetical protein